MNDVDKYNKIAIPSSLDSVIQTSIQRGKNRRKIIYMKRFTTAVAACLALVLLIQVPVVAAALEDIPIIGTIVRNFQISEGGTRKDGLTTGVGINESKLNISFKLEGENVNDVPSYKIEKKEAPYRIEFYFYGVRAFRYDDLVEAALSIKGVKDVYRNIELDDTAISFVIELEENMDYSVSEYKLPGYIELSLVKKQIKPYEIYFLMSNTMENSEILAQIKEHYNEENPTIVRTKQNKFAIAIGNYDNKENAIIALQQLQNKYGNEHEFSISSCYSNENPN